jgi:uncharacterized protein YfaS (alpha-2-macroglobulin family)
MGNLKSILTITITLLLVATACSSNDESGGALGEAAGQSGAATSGAATTDSSAFAEGNANPLRVSLSQGQANEQSDDADPTRVVAGEPLTDARIDEIIDRLPAWVEDPDDIEDFNRPAETLRPPTTGTTIETDFPADGDEPPPAVDSGPLEVLRFQPEGPVELAPFISVTFNQPMVPLGTLDQLDVDDVPVTITPEVAGHWEWIGTRTLRFESDSEVFDRLPMATSYTVAVPAGTESLSGGTLGTAVNWTFETPTAVAQWVAPLGESLGLEPVFLVSFDQAIDPAAVLDVISMTADGDQRDIRLATADEVEADQNVKGQASSLTEGRWLAFTPTEPLPTDSALRIVVGPGTPSAEGPETSSAAPSFDARTYPPLTIEQWECGRCQPLDSFNISFSNPLDDAAFNDSMITVDPEIPGMTIDVDWNNISIRGATAGNTDYKVTVSGDVSDTFGQKLGDEESHTFRVGAASPMLGQFNNQLVVLDPMTDNPALTIPVINHDELRLRVYEVELSQWNMFREYQNSLYDEQLQSPPGREVADTIITTAAEDDVLTYVDVSLGEYLDGAPGQIVVVVEPTGRLADLTRNDELYWNNRPTTTWAQATNIGLDAFSDGENVVAWTTALDTGEPLAGVKVELINESNRVVQTLTTGADGTARGAISGFGQQLIATKGDDLVWLQSGLSQQSFTDAVRWYVVDDRGIYRPGETVRAKGWVRELTMSDDAQIELVAGQHAVSWSVQGPQGNDLATGTSDVSPLGGFDLEFDLPEGTNLGQAVLIVELVGSRTPGWQTDHGFQIQEFRRPEFEVTARNESVGPYFATSPATVAVEAVYFSGGPLPAAPVDWNVTTSPTTYNPPNWDDFTFGKWTPWWYFGGGFEDDSFGDVCCGFEQPSVVEQFSGVTDGSGTHYLKMTFDGAEQDRPSTVTANAAVMDVNRQVWSASTSMVVHSGQYYVGLSGANAFVRKGEPLVIDAIVTDVDGIAIVGRSLDVVAEVLEWKRVGGEWVESPISAQTCSVTTTTQPQTCTFDTELGGRYRISSVVSDDDGGLNRTELTRWISGGKGKPNERVELEEAELVPDQETYQPGDTAEILVQSPFGPAEGLLILTRHKIVETRRFTIDDDTAVLSIPIESEQIPSLGVRVELTGTAPRLDDDGEPIDGVPDRPAYATGSITLRIPPISRTLDVVATPQADALEPGAETSVDVTVRDAAGNPVDGAELLLVVVDEAVLALTGYELADPIDAFYSDLQVYLQSSQTRSMIRLTNSELLTQSNLDMVAESADDMGDASDEEATAGVDTPQAASRQSSGEPIDVRSNFDALAVFEPELTTEADGTATMSFTMPDSLTRYRVMVVAVEGDDNFGSGEANITARLPLQVRPSAPRFLNFGDRFELPVVLQNQTDEAMQVEVVMQVSNLSLTGPIGVMVDVPANDRVEVRFPTTAEDVGTARFRAAAVSGEDGDAATLSLPVYTPSTTEAFATYGVVDNGAVFQPILGPEDVWPQFGGLEINTSSTALQALTDAVIYVNEYEYNSSDAAASQILSIASLRDVLGAFDAKDMPTEAEMDQSVRDAIDTLVGLQNGDGGFPYWSRGRESVPYNSVHVVHALAVARARGFEVPSDTMDRALIYVRDIENFYPTWYSQLSRDTISAYSVHARALAGLRDKPKAEAIYARSGTELSLDALAWLWPVIDDPQIDQEIERQFINRTTETAAGATFVNNYSDDDYVLLHSDRRTDGIVLGSLISQRPDSDLIPKVVQGLLAGKTKGRWGNLQENTFILIALNEYFVTFEDVEPDFVARVWLGDTYAAEHTYEGRTTDQNETLVPMSVLIDEGDTNIVLSKDGQGRLYYRLGLDYAPASLELDPLDRGFVVQRTYEAVDDPGDVRLDDDGVWHVRAGAEVRVRLTMTADSRRTHVALVDPLPAGLEILNPALAPTEDLTVDPQSRSSWWWWQWFNHQNLRDDRAEAFTNVLWAGTYDYTYIARATTPGTFVVPPTKAEEMYTPETFGRSATDTFVVE